MNRVYFQALSASNDENEFTFWVENQPHHPEILSLLVERYASDIYQLGFLWFYGYLKEKPEKFQEFLFGFVLEVFAQALDDISEFNGKDSVGIWLYEIAVQTAERYAGKVTIQQWFASHRGQNNDRLINKTNGTTLFFRDKFENLASYQRLIITLKHTYQTELSILAEILNQDIAFVQYELSTARQELFGAFGPEGTGQESCTDPDYKYILQAHYDRLLPDNEYIPWEFENHLTECKSCRSFNEILNQLGEMITNELAEDPYISFEDSSDRQLIVESIEEKTRDVEAKARRAITFFRRSFVILGILLGVVFFAIRSFIHDDQRNIPLFPPTPILTPTAFVQPSNSFRVISIDQALISQKSSIYNSIPIIMWMREDGGGYCWSTAENETSWLPPEECQEMSIERYNEWISSLGVFKWFYPGFNGPVKPIKSLVFSPDGNTLAGLSIDSHIHFWQAEDGSLLNSIKLNHSATSRPAYSADGNQISVGLQNGTITTVTDLENVKTLLQNFSGPVTSLDYSSDGKSLIVGEKGIAWSFDLSGGKNVALDHYPFRGNQVISVDFSPDGKLVAFGVDDGTIWLYRFEDATVLARLSGHSDKVTQVTFAPIEGYLASGATDGNVILWDISELSSITKLYEFSHPDWIIGLEFSSDGFLLATASLGDGGNRSGVYLWNVSDGNLLDMIPNDGLFTASSIAFSPDGGSLAIGSTRGSVKLWQIPR